MPPPNTLALDYLGAVPGYVLGSMSAGSATLTITGTHSIRVGHTVIVEAGGEAGAGARATVGVGGTWPATSFADEADLLANWTHPATTDGSSSAAYVEDTGDVYYWNGSAVVQPDSKLYHQRKFWPKALIAVVDAVDGATLTLDTAATVATTNARVWVDSWRVFADAIHTPGIAVEVPAGVFALSKKTPKFGSGMGPDAVRNNVTIAGQGATSELYSPRGCPSLSIQMLDGDDFTLRDLTLRGNMGDAGGLTGHDGYISTYPLLAFVQNSLTPTFERVTAINGGSDWGAFQFSGCEDGGVMRECRVEYSEPRHYYGSVWAFQLSDCTDCNTYDCSTDSDYIHTAAELFKTIDSSHTRLTSRNGLLAFNSAKDSYYDGFDVTIEAGSAIPMAYDPNWDPGSALPMAMSAAATFDPGGLSVINSTWRQTGAMGEGRVFDQVISRSQSLEAGNGDLAVTDCTFVTNGHVAKSIVATDNPPESSLHLHIDGVTADAGVDLDGGTIQNTTLTGVNGILRYDSDTTTIGANVNATAIQDVL